MQYLYLSRPVGSTRTLQTLQRLSFAEAAVSPVSAKRVRPAHVFNCGAVVPSVTEERRASLFEREAVIDADFRVRHMAPEPV